VRTLILLLICALFPGVAAWEAIKNGKSQRAVGTHVIIALVVAMLICWVLVRKVGIFDDWNYSVRQLLK
jgi:high-affinity Fe2+/Pb2+ permease